LGSIVIGSGYRGILFIDILINVLKEEVTVLVEKDINKHDYIKWLLAKRGCVNIPIVEDYEEAFKNTPYEVADKVFIITPDFTHREIFEKCIERKYNIFLEKPIATLRNDIVDMLSMSKNYEKTIQVGFVLRYTKFYNEIKRIVDSGALGKIAMIQMNERLSHVKGLGLKKSWHKAWDNTGGFFNEKCSHDIDLMCWIKSSQAKPVKIVSYGSTMFGIKNDKYPKYCSECDIENCLYREPEDELLKEYLEENPHIDRDRFSHVILSKDTCFFHTYAEVFDNQSALIVFDDASHGNLTYVTISSNHGRDIMIHGTDGYLEGNFDKGHLKYINYSEQKENIIDIDNKDKHAGADEVIIREFLEKANNNQKSTSSLEEGALASIIAFQGDYSNYTGKMEYLPTLNEKGDFIPFEEYIRKSKNIHYNS